MAAESSGFFNSEYDSYNDYWDRVYTAEQFASYFANLIGNGVFANSLQVRQNSDELATMAVRVTTGKAFINGYWYSLDEDEYFNVDINTSMSTRVDCICLQYNFNDRVIKVVYHKNTSQPVRDARMYELMLCTINVGSNVLSISQADIGDTRYNSNVCGMVTGLIDQLDFSELSAQFDEFFAEFKDDNITEYTLWKNQTMAEFSRWMSDEESLFDSWSTAQRQALDDWVYGEQNDFMQWKTNQQEAYDDWMDEHEDDFDTWSENNRQAFVTWAQNQESVFTTWSVTQRNAYLTWISQNEDAFVDWMTDQQSDFDDWFANLQDQLDDNQAGHLQNEIDALPKSVNKTLAEYEALPTATKNNGDIYYITNRGIIYRNGRVYGMPDLHLQDVSNVTITIADETTYPHPVIKWTDPADIPITGNQTITWAGTKVVAKVGSAPADETDGTVIVTETTRNSYVTNGYEASTFLMEYDETVYFRFFPYTITDVYTAGTVTSATARRVAALPVVTGDLTYNGQTQEPTIYYNTAWSEIVEYESTTSATSGGTYTIVFRLIDPTNSTWEDGTTTNKSRTWTIKRKPTAIPTVTDTSKVYNGLPQSPTISTYDTDAILITGNTYIGAGNYIVTMSLNNTSNYVWTDTTDTDKTVSWSISPKVVTVPTVTNKSKTYNRNQQSPTISSYDTNDILVTGDTGTNAGTYTITFQLMNTVNLIWSDNTTANKTDTWTISAKSVAIPTVTNTSKTYNGSAQSPTISSYDSNEITVTGNSATDVGNYTVTMALTSTTNYIWSDSTITNKTTAWSIAKANPTFSLSKTSVTFNYSTSSTTVTVTTNSSSTISASSSDTSIATTSVSGKTVTINATKRKGSTTVTISLAASDNYNGASGTVSVDATAYTKIVSWANGTASEIAAMITEANAGRINIADYWSVGDTRNVHLAGSINEDVVFVIEDLNGVTSGGTSYHVAVGQRNGLSTLRQMNSSNTNSGGYNSSVMKTFIEGDYQTALQNATTGNFWSVVKSATHKSQIYSSGLQSTTAKVILHSITELCGYNNYISGDETTANGFHQFSWYTTKANRIKTQGEGGSVALIWTRSASTGDKYSFCNVYTTTGGGAGANSASNSYLADPFCCI